MRAADRSLRVGIQAGHWRSQELPDEQAPLRGSSGAFASGYAEVTVSLDIARRVAALLASDGIVVDVLPATVPPGYAADAVLVRTLQDFVKQSIAPYKYPRAIEFCDALPRAGTGKVQRYRLRQQEQSDINA